MKKDGSFVVVVGLNPNLLNNIILMVKHAYGQNKWSLPGGEIAPGELPVAAALRELSEETGISLKKMELVANMESRKFPGSSVFLFNGEMSGLNKIVFKAENPEEIAEINTFSIKQVLQMDEGEIYPAQKILVATYVLKRSTHSGVIKDYLSNPGYDIQKILNKYQAPVLVK